MAEINPLRNEGIKSIMVSTQPVKPDKFAKEGHQDFQRILGAKITGKIKFSGHALERLSRRNIILGPEGLNRLNLAVEKAESKGARDSLILMDNLALIVSIKNRTVITAIDGEHIKENVFTNIDSAVIV